MTPRRVLLVEDNRHDELLARRALKRCPIEVDLEVARDGEAALERLAADNDVPHLVLLDIKLPRLSGLEVLRGLRAQEHTRYVPVVMVSSSQQEEDVQRSYDGGASGYVRKPLSFNEFQETVDALTEFWLLRNLTPAALAEILGRTEA